MQTLHDIDSLDFYELNACISFQCMNKPNHLAMISTKNISFIKFIDVQAEHLVQQGVCHGVSRDKVSLGPLMVMEVAKEVLADHGTIQMDPSRQQMVLSLHLMVRH